MKIWVLISLLLIPFFTMAQTSSVGQVLDLSVLNEAARLGPESVRDFMKTSGYNWEKAWRCNRALVNPNEIRLRATFCELNVDNISDETLRAVISARLNLGREIRTTFLVDLRRSFPNRTFRPLINCQSENEYKKGFDRECYEGFLSSMNLSPEKISQYLSLLQETALFTLILDHNPHFKECPRLMADQLEDWDAAKLISPFYRYSSYEVPCSAY